MMMILIDKKKNKPCVIWQNISRLELYICLAIFLNLIGSCNAPERSNPNDPQSELYHEVNTEIRISSTNLTITEGGEGNSLTFKLTSPPRSRMKLDFSNTIIRALGSDIYPDCTSFDAIISKYEITFTKTNFDTEQGIDISYPNNDCVHGTIFLILSFPSLIGDDSRYSDILLPEINLTILEEDDLLPAVTPLIPYNNQYNYPWNSHYLKISFNKDMNPGSINPSSFKLSNSDGTDEMGYVWYCADDRTAYFSFQNFLEFGETYTVHLSKNITDIYGNLLQGGFDYEYDFTMDLFRPTLIVSETGAGGVNGIALTGDYVYVADGGSGGGLRVFDISDPGNPNESFFETSAGSDQDVDIEGSYAYVSTDTDGLNVYNISSPGSPVFEDSIAITGKGWHVDAVGSTAYVTNLYDGLEIIDASTPSALSSVGYVSTSDNARDVCVDGNYAYVAVGHAGMDVINITNPGTASVVATYDSPDFARAIAISGTLAFIADSDTLEIIDISNPLNPSFVSSYDIPGVVNDVEIVGNNAYVAHSFGLYILDVSDLQNIYAYAAHDTATSAWELIVSGSGIYLALGSSFQILDSTVSLSKIGAITDTGNVIAAAMTDNQYIYLAEADEGIRVVDVADPANPFSIAHVETPGFVWDIAVHEKLLLAADDSEGLHVYDITNPVLPVYTGTYDTPGFARGVAARNNLAYVGDEISGFQVINISDPANPSLTGSASTSESYNIALKDDYAFVADSSQLRVVDISNPASPGIVHSVSMTGVRGMYISGNLAFGSSTEAFPGLYIVNILDPLSAYTLSYTDIGTSYGAAVLGKHVFVANASAGIAILDITNPSSPQPVETVSIPGAAREILIRGSYAYISSTTAGLQVIFLGNYQP
jgi:hypothetical protein